MEEVYIYKLECIKNGRVYIGKTINPETRKQVHMSQLRCSRHSSKLMQADYEQYGADAFVFTVLEKVERYGITNKKGALQYTDSLREKELMLQYKSNLPEYGYNYNDHYFHPTWGPHRKFKHTAEWIPKRQRMLQCLQEYLQSNKKGDQ